MRALNPVLIAVAVLVLSACGGTDDSTTASMKPQTVELGWRETASLEERPVLEFEVESILFRPRRWTVRGSVTNRSRVRFAILAPDAIEILEAEKQNWTWFGLTWTAGSRGAPVRIVHAESYRPALPKILEPGQTWTGTFSGPPFAVQGRPIRVTFGMFVPRSAPPRHYPAQIGWITDHYVVVGGTPVEGEGWDT
jgi:hypothetical protein